MFFNVMTDPLETHTGKYKRGHTPYRVTITIIAKCQLNVPELLVKSVKTHKIKQTIADWNKKSIIIFSVCVHLYLYYFFKTITYGGHCTLHFMCKMNSFADL